MPIRFCDPESIKTAAEYIRRGEVIAIPTDTVFGLACDAFNEHAMQRIFELKRRPADKPLILMVYEVDQLHEFAIIDNRAMYYAQRYWPGAVTLVFKARPGVSVLLSRNGTVAARIPNCDCVIELIKQFGRPIATTSANISDLKPAVTAEEVLSYFDLLVLDNGKRGSGIPSTIIDISSENERVLRQGEIK